VFNHLLAMDSLQWEIITVWHLILVLILTWLNCWVIKRYCMIRLHERTDGRLPYTSDTRNAIRYYVDGELVDTQSTNIEERMKDIYLRVEGGR